VSTSAKNTRVAGGPFPNWPISFNEKLSSFL
jgi:hypothetical protein